MLTRKLYDKLLNEADSDKISIVIGPRQVGKTTILKQLYEKLGGLFVDMDIFENVELFETYKKAMETLKVEGYKKEKRFFLFIDEFQHYQNLTNIMKNIYDNNNNIKIYATGSSSLSIKNSIQESLAGRKFLHRLYPLDFEEFLMFKGEDVKKLHRIQRMHLSSGIPEFKALLEEFLIYGGYPEVVLSGEKSKILSSIFDTYIKKELVNFIDIDKLLGIKKLIQKISITNANKLNLSDISQSLGIQRNNLESFLEILEETFVLYRLVPFFRNKNKEINKAFKEFFIDTGVRNYFCNNFNAINMRDDSGFLLECFVVSELLKNYEYELKYWQDKKGREIDVIIDRVSSQIGIEVKYKDKLKNSDYKGFEAIGDAIKEKYLVSFALQDERHIFPYCLGKDRF